MTYTMLSLTFTLVYFRIKRKEEQKENNMNTLE